MSYLLSRVSWWTKLSCNIILKSYSAMRLRYGSCFRLLVAQCGLSYFPTVQQCTEDCNAVQTCSLPNLDLFGPPAGLICI